MLARKEFRVSKTLKKSYESVISSFSSDFVKKLNAQKKKKEEIISVT